MGISLETIGEFTVSIDGKELALPKSKRTRALLAYLAITNRPHRRDRLCELFWSVPDDPRGALRWSLSKIRSLVNDQVLERLVADRERVTLLGEDICIDIADINEKIENNHLSVIQLETILKRLQEPFLDGLDLADQSLFQQWLTSERKEMSRMQSKILAKLAEHPELPHSEHLNWTRLWLEQEPFDKTAANKLLTQLEQLGLTAELNAMSAELAQRFKNAGISWPINKGTKETELHVPSSREILTRQRVKFCTTSDGVRLAYASVGKGYPIIKAANWLSHLEHDWDAPIWSPLFRSLSDRHHFLRYDERGNGLSDWEVKDLSFNAFVEDLETVVSASQLDKFALLGISQGASVSIEYAIRHPDKVSHLILFGGYDAGWRINASEEEIREREAIITLTEAGWGKDNPAYRQIFSSTFLPSANKQELDWFNEFQRLTTSAENAARFLSVFGDIDVRHQLSKVKVPTLVIHSLRDQRIPVKVSRDIASNIPNAEFVGLESDGHLLLGREPASKVFVEAVNEFIARNQ